MKGIIVKWNGNDGIIVGMDKKEYFFIQDNVLSDNIEVKKIVEFRPNKIDIGKKGYLLKATLVEVIES